MAGGYGGWTLAGRVDARMRIAALNGLRVKSGFVEHQQAIRAQSLPYTLLDTIGPWIVIGASGAVTLASRVAGWLGNLAVRQCGRASHLLSWQVFFCS
jgi:hypothetical protein